MKNIAIGILFITTVVFCALYFQQSSKTSEAEDRAAGLQQKITGLETDLERQQKQTITLRDRLDTTRDESTSRAGEITQLQQSLAQTRQSPTNQPAEPSTNAKPANPMAALFNDPDVKKMIKDQLNAQIGPEVEKKYADFFAAAHLTPDQTAALKDLLTKKTLATADAGLSMIGGDIDAAKRTEMAAQMKSDADGFDAQIKQLLGDDNYTQFQAYEKTQPDRTTVSSFNDQLAGGVTALRADQQQQLIQLLSQDRQNFKFTTDYNDQSKFNGDFSNYFSEDKLAQFQQESAQLNQLYLSHAGTVLSPEQLAAFQKFLADQLSTEIVGMKMGAKMFNSGK